MNRSIVHTLFAITGFTLLVAGTCDTQGNAAIKKEEGQYVCLPCGSACDTIQYKKKGSCGHCSMKRVERSTVIHSNIEPEEICSFLSKEGAGQVLLLDVRTATEFEGTATEKLGRLKGAVNIPVQELEQRMGELSAWKDKKIIVYCSHSRRSPRAGYMLSQNGFKNVINMQEGMSVWKERVSDKSCNREVYVNQ